MQSFGSYEVEREIGRGATARICLAYHRGSREAVSLKIFHPQVLADKTFTQRIFRELKLSRSLKHPNIVSVYDLLDTDPPALVLEYVDGEDLETFQTRLPYALPELSVAITIEILKGLEYAHQNGLVHRDLKPQNVLIRRDGAVLLTDFGLAKALDATLVTQTQGIIGSLDYMSPEQARGEQVGEASDLFSVGAILYFLVTGTRPFTRGTPISTLEAIRADVPEDATRRNPKVSSSLAEILRRALDKEIPGRFRSATEFRRALESYLASIDLLDVLTLSSWITKPPAATAEALQRASSRLIRRAEEKLEKKDYSGFLEDTAHLALKTSDGAAVGRLMDKYRSARRGKRALALLAVIPFLLAIAWWFGSRPSASPSQAAPIAAVPTAPVATPEPTSPSTATTPASSPREPFGEVRFDVEPGTKVFWDGVEVNPKRALRRQKLGEHILRMELQGFDPIETKVRVTPGKPVMVNAR